MALISRLILPLLMIILAGGVAAQSKSLETTSGNGLTFATGVASPTTERMRITQVGNVGVGVTAPATAVEVSGTVSATILYSQNAMASLPIGVVLPWHKNFTGVPTLPNGWLECNGQTINDAQSPMNGQAVPNLNSQVYAGGRGYYIRGGSTSGNTNPSTVLSGNASKYNFSYSGSNYYGVNYGQFVDTENGSRALYSTTDNTLGDPYFQVAAMTVVFIIKIK